MPLVKNYMSCCQDQMMSIDVKWLNQKIVFYPRVATASGFVAWHCHWVSAMAMKEAFLQPIEKC
jgi:beta-xylosidase